jgi:SAM-dependent methyltransferase
VIRRFARHNGDAHLRADQRLAYLVHNAFDNRSPYRHVDTRLRIADFMSGKARERLSSIPGVPSPSRALCDLFWMHLPWAQIADALGPLRVLDLGCGSGSYAGHWMEWSGGRIAHYLGVDANAHPAWPSFASAHPSVEFLQHDIQQMTPLVAGEPNLIFSQSTIEHVKDDVAVFEQLHAYATSVGRPMLQVHLVPSAACLPLYLWHGYRQYTPRSLSRLTSRDADSSSRLVVRLGGPACNSLHFSYVTWPVLLRRGADRREGAAEEYRRRLAAAIASDMQQPQPSPAFYALLIAHGADAVLESPCWR